VLGAIFGALLLYYLGDKHSNYIRPVLACYTLILGIRIFINAFKKLKVRSKFNRYGLYVLLHDVLADTIIANIETAINPQMKKDIGKTIKCFKQSDTQVVIRLPLEVFDSTYRTSLTTMLIRLSNYDVKFDSFNDFYTAKSALNSVEHSMSPAAQRLTKQSGFTLPKDEWYFSSGGYCGSSHKPISHSIIHNNGVTDWARALNLSSEFTF
jgi:hypothetical protein